MLTKFRLTAILAAGALALGLSTVAQAQVTTDVTVLDGAGNCRRQRSLLRRERGRQRPGRRLHPVVGSTFTFLYQANVVSFNDASGSRSLPWPG